MTADVPAEVLAAVRSTSDRPIPHPRQEPTMTAPHPSPAGLSPLLDQLDEARRLPEHLRGDGPCMDCATLDTPVWFAPNVLWNRVVGGEGTLDDPGGLLCPPCFISRADEAGFHIVAWELTPQWHWETHAEYERRALDAS